MKTLIWIIACLFIGFQAMAQPSPEQHQRVRSMKIAFLTDRIGLTPDEAQKFWPLYKQFEEDQRKLREKQQNHKPLSDMSNQEYERFVASFLDSEEQFARIRRTFFTKLEPFLSAKKRALLIKAEGDFNRKLVESLQRPGRPGGRD